jgi:DNA-binding NarL/FixJ family response regulator
MILPFERRRRRARAPFATRREDGALTGRQLMVLRCAAEGMSARESAAHLGISGQTVKNHLSHVLATLGVDDRTAAVVIALQRGWLKLATLRVRQEPPVMERHTEETTALAA